MDKKFSEGMQEISLDDMEAVTGGVSASTLIGSAGQVEDTVGKTASAAGISMPHAASMSAGSNDIPTAVSDADVVLPPDVPSVLAYCPECKKEKWHRIFSGGRIKCMKCGLVH